MFNKELGENPMSALASHTSDVIQWQKLACAMRKGGDAHTMFRE
jgi:hypothetical protein